MTASLGFRMGATFAISQLRLGDWIDGGAIQRLTLGVYIGIEQIPRCEYFLWS